MNSVLDDLYNLTSTDKELEKDWQINKQHSQKILNEYELDDVEKYIVFAAGLLAGLTDAFFVTDVRKLSTTNKMQFSKDAGVKNLSKSGSVNQWVDERIKNVYSPSEIRKLELDNWVPYDKSSHIDVVGLGPRTHRLQSFGHDPLLGFYYGVRDIMHGTLTAIDNSGSVIASSIGDKGLGLFQAIATQFGHLKSDLCTPAGLPLPFMGQLMRMSGHSDVNGLSYQMLFKGMYMKGYNFNHLITMGIPAIIIEVVVRVSYFAYEIYKGKTFKEAIPFNKPKIDKMLFRSYLIASGCNGVKILATNGNIFAFNPTLYAMTLKYGMAELKMWWTNEKENKRHEYVLGIYDKNIVELNADIDKELNFYNMKLGS